MRYLPDNVANLSRGTDEAGAILVVKVMCSEKRNGVGH